MSQIKLASLLPVALIATLGFGCQQEPPDPAQESFAQQKHALIHERSLAVTEVAMLEDFPLERVLDQLASQSGVPGMTALKLFNQLWDTQNPAPGIAPGPHCDDHSSFAGGPGLNEFPWECPRVESYQAGVDPFRGDPREHLYMPIGLFNRFDLAPSNGAHCGEYRIVYAMRPGHPDAILRGRNFIIFEAILPNPMPAMGLDACKDVAVFWSQLSDPTMSDASRRSGLEKFYFHGLGMSSISFDPVVHVNHYGLMVGGNGYSCSTGQIRTNQFVDGPWNMREYKLTNDCRCGTCELKMVPMTVKDNPYGDLFNSSSPEPLAPALRNTIINQVHTLATNDINRFGYRVDDSLNAAESPIDDPAQINNYPQQFVSSPFGPFASAIAANIPPTSSLTPDHIIARAHALSCAGCHRQSDSADLGQGMIWPNSQGFTHVHEFASGTPLSFEISDGLKDVFLPFREQILMEFLAAGSSGPGADRCAIRTPEPLDLTPAECAELAKTKSARPFPADASRLIRSLRTKWEGRGILGRMAGH